MAANVPALPAVADPDANALLDNAYLPDPNPVINAARACTRRDLATSLNGTNNLMVTEQERGAQVVFAQEQINAAQTSHHKHRFSTIFF